MIMKRTMVHVLVLTVAFCANAATTYSTEIDGSTWSYTLSVAGDMTTNATITAVVPADGALVVPSVVDGYTVTTIGNNFGKSNANLKSLRIPDSVQVIGSGAFTWCTSLGEVVLGDGLTAIGGYSYASTDTSGPTNMDSFKDKEEPRKISL